MARKDVFIVEPPTDTVQGNYLLIIQRGSTMFGTTSTAFAIDELVGTPYRSLRGILRDKVVVEFPRDTSYIMIDRGLVTPTSMTDLDIQDRKDAIEHQKIVDAEFPPEKRDAVAIRDDGTQRVNTQGYL